MSNRMWARRVELDEGRMGAWWEAMDSCLEAVASRLSFASGQPMVCFERKLRPIHKPELASWFVENEEVATAVFAPLEGDTKAQLAFFSHLPATCALDLGPSLFEAFAYGCGGLVGDAFAVMDMKPALACALSMTCEQLDVQAVASIAFKADKKRDSAELLFIPDWKSWPISRSLERVREAA